MDRIDNGIGSFVMGMFRYSSFVGTINQIAKPARTNGTPLGKPCSSVLRPENFLSGSCRRRRSPTNRTETMAVPSEDSPEARLPYRPKPDEPEPKGRRRPSAVRATLDDPPIHIRPTVPAISGCKAKEPFRFRPLRHVQGGTAAFQSQRIFCRKRQESGDKRLRFSPDAAVEKWPLRGSLATSRRCHWPMLPRQSVCSSPMDISVRPYAGGSGSCQMV